MTRFFSQISGTVLFLLLSNTPFFLSAQNKVERPLQQGELNRVLNSAFNKIVASNPNAGEIANYASLDLVNATFDLKSTIPIQPGKKKRFRNVSFENQLGNDPGNISYLTLTINGGLIDNKYGALFSDSKLNTGINLGLQYNFKLKNPQFSFMEEDWNEYSLNRNLLMARYNNNRIDLEKNLNNAALQRTRYLLQLKQLTNTSNLEAKQLQLDLVQKSIDSLGPSVKERPGLADTIQKLVTETAGLLKEKDAVTASLDSLILVEYDLTGHKIIQLENMRTKLKQDYDTLLSKVILKGLAVSWFTVSGTYSRKSYSTFDATLPFESQIAKNKLNAFNFGFAYNYLIQNRLNNHLFFTSLGISYLKDNNLALLSTTTIEQTKNIVNSTGDISRKITNKYNAYTDPVESFTAWNVYAHVYYIFGKTPSGFHLYPSINFQSNKKTISNFTAGYLISFQNAGKDKTVVNTEFYIRLNDVFNDSNADSKFYTRNEIGVSFTLPFQFLLN